MSRKLALKRLTASDLTLFKWHFQNRPAGKQKAFNLDARVLVNELYPQLGEPSSVPQPRYPLDLHLIGPGHAPANNLQRKILKQQKNWRLNGELIHNPEEDPARYDVLEPGDFALFEFSGYALPTTAKVVLVARNVPEDAAVYDEIDRRYVEGSMWSLQESDVLEILSNAEPSTSHPLFDWVESEAMEDAVLGGAEGLAKLSKRRAGKGISPEDFIRARQAAELAGVAGEEAINDYCEKLLAAGHILQFEWTASVNAVAPYDFHLTQLDDTERLADAKSTMGNFRNPIHLSLGELYQAVEGGKPYDIYRVFELTQTSAKLRVAQDIGPVMAPILSALRALPEGITVDAITVRTDLLPFSTKVIILDLVNAE